MKYTFHPEAEAEFLDSIGYYEDCELGLGYDFAVEVHSTIESILSFPKAWTILSLPCLRLTFSIDILRPI